jgi:hypothetical protein
MFRIIEFIFKSDQVTIYIVKKEMKQLSFSYYMGVKHKLRMNQKIKGTASGAEIPSGIAACTLTAKD